MHDKEYLILEFLYNQKSPISFDELENGLMGHFEFNPNESILSYLSKIESKGLLSEATDKLIQINELGKVFFEKERKIRKKQALTKAREDWKNRNWFIADVIKLFIGAIIGSAITLSTTWLTGNLHKHQENSIQSPVLLQDTSNKKRIH